MGQRSYSICSASPVFDVGWFSPIECASIQLQSKTDRFCDAFGWVSEGRTALVMERAMGIDQIRMNQTKALPPASQFNWSQMESNPLLR
jgi:hypothetical protein